MSPALSLRVLYLRRWDSGAGRDALRGRRLFDTFRAQSADCLLAHRVVDKSPDPTAIGTDKISRDTFERLGPNVVFLEGGLFDGRSGPWRFERSIAEAFVRDGGVFIVADVDANHWNDPDEGAHLVQACDFFQTSVSNISPIEVAQVFDSVPGTRIFRSEVICDPPKMNLDQWPAGIYDGISRIVVGLPVHLWTVSSYPIASGNRDTARVASDFGMEAGDTAFATAAQIGAGYAVLIAGGVTDDVWAKKCPDNPQWLVNVASVLVADAQQEKARIVHALTAGHRAFLSHRSTDGEIASHVAVALRRAGIDTWLDTAEIVAGDSFVRAIDMGLGSMTAFVLFWSGACVDSTWVDHEVNVAIKRMTEQDVPIMIVRLDTTPVPGPISDLHRIEAEGMSAGEIARTIAEAIARRRSPPRARSG